jgi:hypothetical protein
MGSGNDLTVKITIPSFNLSLNIDNQNGSPSASIVKEGLVVET